MKKVIKSRIFIFILGGLIFGTTTGVVAYNYNASQVSYTPKDSTWNVNNVGDAINSLKENSNISLVYKNTVNGNITSTYTFNSNIELGIIVISAANNTNDTSLLVSEIESLSSGTYEELDNSYATYHISDSNMAGNHVHAYIIKNVNEGSILNYKTRYTAVIQIIKLK